jgi:hypothetical protein
MREKLAKKRSEAKAKAKKAAPKEDNLSDNSVEWHSVKKAMTMKLDAHTAYLDSGASHHMISDRSTFATYSTDAKCKIEMADGQFTTCPGKGFVYVKTKTGASMKLECLHVPQLVGNLISMGRLCRRGCSLVCLSEDRYELVNEGQTLFKSKISDIDVFLIKLEIIKGKSSALVKFSSKSISDIEKLHRRAGHPSNESLKKMFNLPAFELNCEACSLSKSHRLLYPSRLPDSQHCLESIHFDLSGRINPPTPEGYEY